MTLYLNGVSFEDVTIPDQTRFIRSLYVGDGGGRSTTAIGTNPVDPLEFESNGSYNGTRNTFVGMNAGTANTAGNWNTFVGESAGAANTVGDQNTFIGGDSGISNTNGYHNTFVGTGAGQDNTTGYFNTYLGTDAGLHATGIQNTVAGASAGSSITGTENSFFGHSAGGAVTSGGYNSFLGAQCAPQLTTGTYNQGIGRSAGSTLTGGSHNTFLGDSTSVAAGVAAWVDSSTAIGVNAQITASNQVIVGGSNVTQTLIAGNVGLGGTSSRALLDLNAGALVGTGLQLPHVVNKTASANVRNSHNAEATSQSAAYAKVKTITLTNGLVGQHRFLFDLKTSDVAATAYGRVYRNGSALGTEQTDVTGGYVTKSEDLTQTWNPGDTAELWVKISDVAKIVYVQNFRIAYDDAPTVAVASANS